MSLHDPTKEFRLVHPIPSPKSRLRKSMAPSKDQNPTLPRLTILGAPDGAPTDNGPPHGAPPMPHIPDTTFSRYRKRDSGGSLSSKAETESSFASSSKSLENSRKSSASSVDSPGPSHIRFGDNSRPPPKDRYDPYPQDTSRPPNPRGPPPPQQLQPQQYQAPYSRPNQRRPSGASGEPTPNLRPTQHPSPNPSSGRSSPMFPPPSPRHPSEPAIHSPLRSHFGPTRPESPAHGLDPAFPGPRGPSSGPDPRQLPPRGPSPHPVRQDRRPSAGAAPTPMPNRGPSPQPPRGPTPPRAGFSPPQTAPTSRSPPAPLPLSPTGSHPIRDDSLPSPAPRPLYPPSPLPQPPAIHGDDTHNPADLYSPADGGNPFWRQTHAPPANAVDANTSVPQMPAAREVDNLYSPADGGNPFTRQMQAPPAKSYGGDNPLPIPSMPAAGKVEDLYSPAEGGNPFWRQTQAPTAKPAGNNTPPSAPAISVAGKADDFYSLAQSGNNFGRQTQDSAAPPPAFQPSSGKKTGMRPPRTSSVNPPRAPEFLRDEEPPLPDRSMPGRSPPASSIYPTKQRESVEEQQSQGKGRSAYNKPPPASSIYPSRAQSLIVPEGSVPEEHSAPPMPALPTQHHFNPSPPKQMQEPSRLPGRAASPAPPRAASPAPPRAASPLPPRAASPLPPRAASPLPPQAASQLPPRAASPLPPRAASPLPPPPPPPVPRAISPEPDPAYNPDDDIPPHLRPHITPPEIMVLWSHASLLYHSAATPSAMTTLKNLKLRPGVPDPLVPLLDLNAGLMMMRLATEAHNHPAGLDRKTLFYLASEDLHTAIEESPGGEAGLLGLFLLGCALMESESPREAAECFDLCADLFRADGWAADAVDMHPLGLEWSLALADVHANREICDSAAARPGSSDWIATLRRVPADLMLESPQLSPQGDIIPSPDTPATSRRDRSGSRGRAAARDTLQSRGASFSRERTDRQAHMLARLGDMRKNKPLPVLPYSPVEMAQARQPPRQPVVGGGGLAMF